MQPNQASVETAPKPKVTISMMERGGTVLTALAALGTAGAAGYWEYAKVSGTVALTVDQLKSTLQDGGYAVIALAALALIASIINIPHLIGHMRRGPIISSVVSVATLAGAVAFLFLSLLPKGPLTTFALTMQSKCQTPLTAITDKTTGDIALANKAASADAGNDTQFIADMNKYSQIFQDDATKATNAAAALDSVKPSDPKYQPLINDCKQEFLETANFLTGSNGVTLPTSLPAPFSGVSLSAANLLSDSALLTEGKFPGLAQPIPSTLVSQVVTGVLTTALNTCSETCQHLTTEGNQLTADTFAPFVEQK